MKIIELLHHGKLTAAETNSYDVLKQPIEPMHQGLYFKDNGHLYNLAEFTLANFEIRDGASIFAKSQHDNLVIEVVNRKYGMYRVEQHAI